MTKNNARKVLESGSLSAKASDLLSVAPIFHKYYVDVVRPCVGAADVAAIDVFLHCCDIVSLLLHASRGWTTPAQLKAETFAFMNEYQVVFGEYNWAWKFHGAMELTLQWENMFHFIGKLPSCFAMERKHKNTN